MLSQFSFVLIFLATKIKDSSCNIEGSWGSELFALSLPTKMHDRIRNAILILFPVRFNKFIIIYTGSATLTYQMQWMLNQPWPLPVLCSAVQREKVYMWQLHWYEHVTFSFSRAPGWTLRTKEYTPWPLFEQGKWEPAGKLRNKHEKQNPIWQGLFN